MLSGTTLAVDGATYDLSLANSTTADEILTVSDAPTAPAALPGDDTQSSHDLLANTPSSHAAPLFSTAAVPEPSATASLLSAFALAIASSLRRRK